MARSSNIFIRFLSNFLGIVFFLTILILLFCLFKFLYFPAKPNTVIEKQPLDKFSMTIDQPLGTEHFHVLDKKPYNDSEDASICLQCHGNFCHTESKKLRSFYNMHTFYLACETCHIKIEPGNEVKFQWFNDKDGDKTDNLLGDLGRYNAKIVTVKAGRRLDNFPLKKMAIDYIRLESTYSKKEKKEIRKKLMSHISEKALSCKDCHIKDGYLNFNKLGYNRLRIEKLTRLDIVQMLDEYKDFYLPTMFDPGKAGKKPSAPAEESKGDSVKTETDQ